MTWTNLSTQQRIDRIRQLSERDVPRNEQAAYFGIRATTLSQFCSAHALRANNDNPDSEWSDLDDQQRRERIVSLREDDDLSLRDIASELGVAHGTIYQFCQTNGLERLFERRVTPKPPMIPARPVADKTWAVVGGQPKTLMDLGDDDCRWPVDVAGATNFCGCRAVGGGSYCEVHALMAKGETADV